MGGVLVVLINNRPGATWTLKYGWSADNVDQQSSRGQNQTMGRVLVVLINNQPGATSKPNMGRVLVVLINNRPEAKTEIWVESW
jgi:hypothetical protein